jgi:uncharacterized protein
MLMRLRISWSKGEVFVMLDDTPTARKLRSALPWSSMTNMWGDEVYFEVPVNAALESDAQQIVAPGTICFWVEGHSLAIPFGPTPISQGNECRLVTKVNVLGRLEGDPRLLQSICAGEQIHLEAAP